MMLKNLIFLTIVALFVITACTKESEKFLSYENKEYDISAKYPAGWERIDEAEDALVAFRSPQENKDDQFQETISLAIIELREEEKRLTLDEITDAVLDSLKQSDKDVKDFKLIDSSKIKVDGKNANKIVYTANIKDIDVKTMQVWILKDYKVYVATYVSEVDKFSKFLPTVNKIVDSLKV